uniref:BHLH domain-containing protein n=1 Tax=Eptatretus burgeri TaxID=7764 RepID=A0A8C4WRY7_EPTBU
MTSFLFFDIFRSSWRISKSYSRCCSCGLFRSSWRSSKSYSRSCFYRKRIRSCCDELNYLVPFCTPETDKATTLQQTTGFLMYIQEKYGEDIKKGFECVFRNKTAEQSGIMLKKAWEMKLKNPAT